MATFEFKCKHCSQKMEADESMIGQTAECPACGQSLQIEKPASPESPNRKFLPAEDKNPLPPPPASRNSASPGKSVLLLLVGGILLVNLLLLIVTVWPNSWEYKAVKVRGNLTKYEKLEKFFPKELEELDGNDQSVFREMGTGRNRDRDRNRPPQLRQRGLCHGNSAEHPYIRNDSDFPPPEIVLIRKTLSASGRKSRPDGGSGTYSA